MGQRRQSGSRKGGQYDEIRNLKSQNISNRKYQIRNRKQIQNTKDENLKRAV
jgi:hypothetical protein